MCAIGMGTFFIKPHEYLLWLSCKYVNCKVHWSKSEREASVDVRMGCYPLNCFLRVIPETLLLVNFNVYQKPLKS